MCVFVCVCVCVCVCVGVWARVCVCVCTYQVSFLNLIEILTTNNILMTKVLLLTLSNQVLLQDSIWKCGEDSSVELENSVH